jgi:SnoaL-like domain
MKRQFQSAMATAALLLCTVFAPGIRAQETPPAFPLAEITAAVLAAGEIANKKGYAAFMEETFVKDDNILVQSEEFFPIFYGRDQVSAYYKPPTDNLYAHREQYSNVEGTFMSPTLALVTWHNRYDMQAVGRAAVGGWSRMIATMRKTDEGWKFVTLVQSPMSLVSQARRIQEEAVSADFLDYARKQNPDYDQLIAGDKRLASRRSGLPWLSGGGNTQDAVQTTPAPAPGSAKKENQP